MVESLEEIIENRKDGVEAAEATGILAQIRNFSFLVLLTTFDSILGLTKPLSDTLQVKHLNLSTAMELVGSVIQVLKKMRSEDHFKTKIWKESQQMADEADVAVTLPNPRRKTSLPARLREGQVLESTGGRDQAMLSVYDSYKALYYQAVDKVLVELDKRFIESRPLLQSIGVLSPKSPSFLDLEIILPLADAYKLDIVPLSNQLEIARVMLASPPGYIIII